MTDGAGAPVERAAALLREAGVEAEVRGAGREGEIAAVTASPGALERLREVAPEIRALGFRYVALDLTGSDQSIRE